MRISAWLLLAGLAFVTLSPIGLRPVSGLAVQLERFLAFAVLGGAFALAYPRRALLVGTIVVGSAVLLELLQRIDPGRHGQVADAAAKIAGGIAGLLLGLLLARLLRINQRDSAQ